MDPLIWVWLGSMILFIIIEILTTGLTTIWFAGGSVAALITSLAGLPWWVQVITFILISGLLLVLTRPFLKKIAKKGYVKTNADSLIGQYAKVTDEVNGSGGTAYINGLEWSAVCDDPHENIGEGEFAEIVRIEGVKLILRRRK